MEMIATSTKEKSCIITFKELFSYRSVWMLLAIIWIALFHSPMHLPGNLMMVNIFGYGGTDIFFFASGIGCYFSLKKQPDVKVFLKKRLSKLYPMWLIMMLFYLPYQIWGLPKEHMSFQEIFGNFFAVGFLADLKLQFNWYIGAQFLLYFLAPALCALVRDNKFRYNILLFAALLVASMIFFESNLLIFCSRLPVFFLGIIIAELSTKKVGLSLFDVVFCLALMPIGIFILYFCYNFFPELLKTLGMWWYPFIFLVPGMVLLISLGAKLLSKTVLKFVVTFMDKLGKHTFAICLSHVLIFDVYLDMYLAGLVEYSALNYILSIVAVVVFCFVLTYLDRLFQLLMKKITAHSF